MTINTPRKALDRALTGPLSLSFSTQRDAEAFRHACYVTRGRARQAARKAYPDPADPMYDTSPWDDIRIDLTGDTLRFRLIKIEVKEVIDEEPVNQS